MSNELNSEGRSPVEYEVKWRGGFADRENIDPVSTEIQKDSLNDRVRTKLSIMNNDMFGELDGFRQVKEDIMTYILQNVYLTEYEARGRYQGGSGIALFRRMTKDTIKNDVFASVFSLIESLSYQIKEKITKKDGEGFEKIINIIFEEEYVGYRIINSIITPITNEIELSSIKKTLKSPYLEVKNHTSKALENLSNVDNPDYGNSIRESILSVEAMAKIITGNNNDSLGKALKKMEKEGFNIEPTLKKAFGSLYGFTNQIQGGRHAQIGGEDPTLAEAQFMLVSCSAFNNYLKTSNSK